MKLTKFLVDETIVVNTFEEATEITKILLNNNYCAMLSREENFWVINWVWSPDANRNGAIFLSREIYESDLYKYYRNEEKGVEGEYDYL